MKKQLFAALALLITCVAMAQTTPETKESKFSFLVNSKIGFAKLKQTGNILLNGDITGGDILGSYALGKNWSVSTGVGFMELDANQTIAGNTANITNNYLHIPLQFNGNYAIFGSEPKDQKIFFTLGIGAYASTLLKSELQTITGTTTLKNQGWNFGMSSQVGAKFLATDYLTLGIGLESQTDFSKMKKDGNEQKIKNLNAVYFALGIRF